MKKFLILTGFVWATLPLLAQHFTVDYTLNPKTFCHVVVSEAQIGGVNLGSGDEIAVFDGSICCGVLYLTEAISDPLPIAAGKAETTQPGYTAGHNISIKVWDSSAGSEYNASVEFLSSITVFTDTETIPVNVIVKQERTIRLTATNKEYDATTSAGVGYTIEGGSVTGDVTITASNGSFNNSSVGTGKTVTGTITVSGADAGNYEFTKVESTTASITKKGLTVANAVAANKVYDGTTSASITGATLVGAISGDAVSIGNAVGTFSQKNVGNNISVTAAITLTGASSGNYSLSQPTGLSANITKKTITVTANNRSKDCNQNDPTLTYSFSPSLASGDSFSGTLSRESGEELGEYDILQGTLSLSSNYTLVFNKGVFTIRDDAPYWVTGANSLNRTVIYSDNDALVEAQSLAPVAGDHCDPDVSDIVKTSGEFVPDATCSEMGTYTNTWIVTDNSGNISDEFTQVITLIDNVDPVFQPVQDMEVIVAAGSCETTVDYPELVVDDACIDTIKLIAGFGPDASFPVGNSDETWVAIDKSGNTDTLTFSILVVSENENPVIDAMEDMQVTTATQDINLVLTGIYGNACTAGQLSVSAIAENTDLISYINVIYCGNNSKAILEIKLADDVEGSSMITITVQDDQERKTEETFSIKVGAVNSAPFLVSAAEDVEVHADHSVSIYISEVLGEYFDDADGDELSFEVYTEGTEDLPSWISYAEDSITCLPAIADTGCVNIVVKAIDPEGLYATDTITICALDYVLGANDGEQKSANINVYPNPTTGTLTVNLGSFADESALTLFDMNGKMLIHKNYFATDRFQIDLSEYEAGIYFVKTEFNGLINTQKVIVKK